MVVKKLCLIIAFVITTSNSICYNALGTEKQAIVHRDTAIKYFDEGNIKGAIKECEKGIETKPDATFFYVFLGHIYEQQMLYDEAILQYKKAIQIDPGAADAHSGLGIVYERKGLYDLAISEYKKTIEIVPAYYGTYIDLGLVYETKGEIDKAEDMYKIAVQLNPKAYDAHSHIERIKKNKKR